MAVEVIGLKITRRVKPEVRKLLLQFINNSFDTEGKHLASWKRCLPSTLLHAALLKFNRICEYLAVLNSLEELERRTKYQDELGDLYGYLLLFWYNLTGRLDISKEAVVKEERKVLLSFDQELSSIQANQMDINMILTKLRSRFFKFFSLFPSAKFPTRRTLRNWLLSTQFYVFQLFCLLLENIRKSRRKKNE